MSDGRPGVTRGLSPRARGNPGSRAAAWPSAGTIPACAGEPLIEDVKGDITRDYPRVRGGTGLGQRANAGAAGLSPRARGNLWTGC